MKNKLNIAVIADPEIPDPPVFYGGIERIIYILIMEYLKAGHEVTLFAHKESRTNATLLHCFGQTSHRKIDILQNLG